MTEEPNDLQLLQAWRMKKYGLARSGIRGFLPDFFALVGVRSGTSNRAMQQRGSKDLPPSIRLEVAAGVEETSKLTDNALYEVAYKELLTTALSGRMPRKAPQLPTIVLAAFEERSSTNHPQSASASVPGGLPCSVGTLRFPDH